MDPRTARMLQDNRAPTQPAYRGPWVSPAITDWIVVNWFRASLATAMLIVAGAVGYYLTVTIPNERAAEAQDKALTHIFLDRCISATNDDYGANWKQACATRDLPDDCSLPTSVADRLDRVKHDAEDLCTKHWPAR